MHSMRITALLLAASLFTNKASADQLSAEQASVLAEVRVASLAYTSKLPDFICTQTTYRETEGFNRFGASIGEARLLSTDLIEEKLTYFRHQESYEVVAINRKKATGLQHTQVAGAISTGEFGSLLHDIFDPDSHAAFTWGRMDKLHGRLAYVFAFQVPREAGVHVADKISKQEISASYHGMIFVDADSQQVLRITTHIDLPQKFEIKLAERAVDYRPANLAGKIYDLPYHSEVRMQDSSYTYLNKIDFKDYHKFTVESTVNYGNGAPSRQTAETPADAPGDPVGQPPSSPAINQEAVAPPAITAPSAPTAAQEAAASPNAASPVSPPIDTVPVTGQTLPASPGPPAPDATAVADTNYRLQVKVNVVLVPVVARDSENHAVGYLLRNDFLLFDRNKQQDITSFSLESHAIPSWPEFPLPGAPLQTSAQKPANNFIVYLFDDLHLEFTDLARVRDAAGYSMERLLPTDRAAIFTTSGLVTLDFTVDRAQLHEALSKLRPHPLGGVQVQQCPDISFYMANQMLNIYDPTQISANPPLQAATAETMACMSLPSQAAQLAQDRAIAKARNVLTLGGQESHNTLLSMRQIVHMITLAPGTKTLLLVSPGFGLENGSMPDATAVVEQAIRANVVINALDARGLYTVDEAGNIQNQSANTAATRMKVDLDRDAAREASGVMGELAAATGGAFIHNTNDFESGFRRLTAPPEYTYLLGFVPEKLKPDGSFHPLKIKLGRQEKLTLQARSGYYAPKK